MRTIKVPEHYVQNGLFKKKIKAYTKEVPVDEIMKINRRIPSSTARTKFLKEYRAKMGLKK